VVSTIIGRTDDPNAQVVASQVNMLLKSSDLTILDNEDARLCNYADDNTLYTSRQDYNVVENWLMVSRKLHDS